ncbi:MAG TPA: hypothetical protein VFW65_08015 [Pseudonocardiaceae bacterium]|nr:hypothetical protein [Pseudonocardiaceae bacterium]
MRVQVTEAMFGESAPVQAALRAAGHDVIACHGDTGLCLALQPGRRCPLDLLTSVDLMVGGSLVTSCRTRRFGCTPNLATG